jgi:hypothetical protein
MTDVHVNVRVEQAQVGLFVMIANAESIHHGSLHQ